MPSELRTRSNVLREVPHLEGEGRNEGLIERGLALLVRLVAFGQDSKRRWNLPPHSLIGSEI